MLITDAAVQEAALALTEHLDGDWVLDPEAPADGAAHLLHRDGRGISFRPVFGGTTAQIWITGAAAPSMPADATAAERDAHEAQLAVRLAEGHRYNRAISLLSDDDEDPADLILITVENHLLPAFTLKPRYVGHRPWADLVAEVLNEARDETTPVGTSLRDCGPEAHTRMPDQQAEPESEPTPAPHPEAGDDSVSTSDAPAPQGDEETDPAGPDEPQETVEASTAIDAQEPEGEEAPSSSAAPSPVDGAGTATPARRPAAKRRPRNRASDKKPRPTTTP
ncbi:hypothetical protein ACWFR1_22860 [Streptomyces sp. NPDC055103]